MIRDKWVVWSLRNGSKWALPIAAIVSWRARKVCVSEEQYPEELAYTWELVEGRHGDTLVRRWLDQLPPSAVRGSLRCVQPPPPCDVMLKENWGPVSGYCDGPEDWAKNHMWTRPEEEVA